MKLKYIFTLLGVMLLGLTSCGKKDAHKTNPFAGTLWERTYKLTPYQRTYKLTPYQGESEVITEELHFVDNNHVTVHSRHKIIAEDGTVKKEETVPDSKITYMHKGLIATAFNSFLLLDKEYHIKITFTMDEAKQKLTVVASNEGEKDQTTIFALNQTAIFTRKK